MLIFMWVMFFSRISLLLGLVCSMICLKFCGVDSSDCVVIVVFSIWFCGVGWLLNVLVEICVFFVEIVLIILFGVSL